MRRQSGEIDGPAILMFLLGGLAIILLIIMLAGLFVYMPVTAYTESKCLEKGYPRSAVTWDLKQYCMNLEGIVTIRVDKQ